MLLLTPESSLQAAAGFAADAPGADQGNAASWFHPRTPGPAPSPDDPLQFVLKGAVTGEAVANLGHKRAGGKRLAPTPARPGHTFRAGSAACPHVAEVSCECGAYPQDIVATLSQRGNRIVGKVLIRQQAHIASSYATTSG